jgi:hypothetical protein
MKMGFAYYWCMIGVMTSFSLQLIIGTSDLILRVLFWGFLGSAVLGWWFSVESTPDRLSLDEDKALRRKLYDYEYGETVS